MRTMTLDRRQREALRREAALGVDPWGELRLAVEKGDRAYCARALEQLSACVAALDAIGWTESAEAPDVQPVEADAAVQAWAAEGAAELVAAFDEFDPDDLDLDAYGALCVIGGER